MSGKEQSVGILAQVFAGGFDHHLLFPYPSMSEEEQEMLRLLSEGFKSFAKRHLDPVGMDETHEMPQKVIEALGELGILGTSIPEEYGGAGVSMQVYCKLFETVGGTDASTAVTAGAHQSIGLKALLLFGNEEQKKRHLPALATGERIAAFALTEAEAGSDAASVKTRATWDDEKKVFRLDGSKLWITNGGIASFFTVFARDEMNGKDRLTAFIVSGDAISGLTRGKPEKKLGIRASNTVELHFEGVEVAPEEVLGERGQGFRIALEVLNYGRLSLGAGCVGGMKVMLALAADHAKQRKQFGAPIGDLEMIQGKLARMAQECWAAESMVYLAASLVDRGVEDFSLESAACKAYCSEAAWRTADAAMQVVGGVGYMCEYPYERMLRDTRINLIFEGTNEIQRLYITLAGLKRQGDFLKGLGHGSKVAGLVEYSLYAAKKRLTTQQLEGLHPSLEWFSEKVETWVKSFSLAVDETLVKHGKAVLKMGFTQERLADVAILLFGMLATLSRLDTLVKAQGEEACAHERALTRAWYGWAWREVRRCLGELQHNGDKTASALAGRVLEDVGYRVLE